MEHVNVEGFGVVMRARVSGFVYRSKRLKALIAFKSWIHDMQPTNPQWGDINIDYATNNPDKDFSFGDEHLNNCWQIFLAGWMANGEETC